MATMTPQPVEPPDTSTQLRTRYLAAVDAVEAASERTIAVLVASQEVRDLARANVAAGRPMTDLEHMIEPHSLRASVSDALTELERTRHHAQRLLFQLLHAEGQTMADIGRTWGISRQLVSRLVNEPDPSP
jgi:DNA-directed RNA polymerase sigma subunit (sigma70/sigma32)